MINKISPFGKTSPLAAGSVRNTTGLFAERRQMDIDALIPHVLSIFDDENSFFHEVENLRITAGLKDGEFRGNPFGDGDFYKLLEGMFYAGTATDNKEMLDKAEEYAQLIALAQQPDGYLSTKQIIAERHGENIRHSDIDDFEEYNFGHLFTCACTQKQLTGSDTLMTVARKGAQYLLQRYERLIEQKVGATAVCPSHYMGLIDLYRLTGDDMYLHAAKLALKLRDYVIDGIDDNQDRVLLREQRTIVGHAVRATYLYAGVADIYLESGDESLLPVLDSCFDDLITKKIYINGGCGALYTGSSPVGDLVGSKRVHQAFGYAYQLPNAMAYNETCASLGLAFWARRMFMINPSPHYFDWIERAVYNLALAAVSMDGMKYFYENMLSRTWSMDDKLMWPLYRSDNFECFCCPTNLARFLAQIPEYAYMTSEQAVYCGLYMESTTDFQLENGAAFTLEQKTEWPWAGDISFTVKNANNVPFDLMVRVPQWAQDADRGTYRMLHMLGADEVVELSFDFTPRLMISHAKVEESAERVCIMSGPLVYCLENQDKQQSLDDLVVPSNIVFEKEWIEIDGKPVLALNAEALQRKWEGKDETALYQALPKCEYIARNVQFIPYFAWDNRGFGEMRCWLPLKMM